MLFPERMKKIELHVLKSDLDAVMRHLAGAGCMQLISENREGGDAGGEEREAAELLLKVQAIARFLGVDERPGSVELSPAPSRESLRVRTSALADAVKGLVEEEEQLVQRRLALRQSAEELASYEVLDVPLKELEDRPWITIRSGSVAPDRLHDLGERLRNRALVIPLGRPGQILAITTKKGRWALDSELRRADFQEGKRPAGDGGLPSDMLAAVTRECAAVDARIADLETRKAGARDSLGEETRALLAHLGADASIDSLKQGFGSTGSVQKITGWVPARRFARMSAELDGVTKGRMALQSWDPEELSEIKERSVRVPVSTPHGRIVRGFSRMVFSYAVPLYGTVDPTPFVAVMFVLLFAIMFGDVGQGFVGVLLGLAISSGRVKSFAEYRRRHFGVVFLLAGAASMVAGLLYGSVFANEAVLVPATRFVTAHLFGTPMDRVVSLEGFQRIIVFFGITIGIGAVINSLGLVINLVNTVRRRDWKNALLAKTGLAGAFFFWYVLSVGVRIIMGGRLHGFDFAVIALPLLALFFREPLLRLVEGHRPLLKEGAFGFVMEGIAEVLEAAIYYVSNSVSFLRVAAFGLAHTVLSTIIVLLATMVGGGAAGPFFTVLIYLIGNSIIVVLEGLVVTIQVVRLEYYEFFSKFFTESGEQFAPFNLGISGGPQ